MKKIILLVAALAATIATAFAEPESTKSHKQHFDFRDFTAISLSHSFQTELTFADTYSVDIEVPDFIEPYLKVSCLGGKLRIGSCANSTTTPAGSRPGSRCPRSRRSTCRAPPA